MSSSSEKKFDVVIVGAGIIGCSIAFHLALKTKGAMKIAVVDRETLASEASLGAAGMLAAQVESAGPGAFLDLCLESRKLFPSLIKNLKKYCKTDPQYTAEGMAQIAWNKSQENLLKERVQWQKKNGLSCRWLSPEKVQEMFPFIETRTRGAFFAPEDGQISAQFLSEALARSAQKLGVHFFENENCFVPAIDGKLTYISRGNHKFFADKFVIACGAWTGLTLNNRIATVPVKGQILVYEAPSDWIKNKKWNAPLYLGKIPDSEIDCYAVPKPNAVSQGSSQIFVGATSELAGFDKSENKISTEKMQRFITSVIPEMKKFKLNSVWVGLRPASADRLPILGKLPQTENVFVAAGHFRNGVLLSPVTGKWMAEILTSGKTSTKIKAFSPERFW